MTDFSKAEMTNLADLTESVGQTGQWRFNARQDQIDWSQQIYRVFGRPFDRQPQNRTDMLAAFHPDDRDMVNECLQSAIRDHEDFSLDARVLRPDGSTRFVKIAGRPFASADKAVDAAVETVLGVIVDVTEYKRTEQRLRRLAETDPLTGIANVRHFETLADAELRRAARFGRDAALAIIDIDGFKNINDTFGHLAGDEVLRCFVGAMEETLREIDIIARIGGDEFAILMPETQAADAILPLERLLANIRTLRVEQENVTIPLSFSGGVTQMRPDANLQDLMREADVLLYRAKRAGPRNIEMLAADENGLRQASS